MKKIYSLLLLFTGLFAATATAQSDRRYGLEGGALGDAFSLNVDEIKPGVTFVMQSGTTLGDADFLRGVQKSVYLNDENLFEVEATGEESASGLPIYRLKNKSKNQYVADGNFSYTESATRAWKFYIQEPISVTQDEINLDPSENPIEDFTNITTIEAEQSQVIFTDAKCVADTTVTNKNTVKFLCSGAKGKNSYFGRNFGENTWECYTVVELKGADYLQNALEELYPEGTDNLYNPGTEPGQISEELHKELMSSYDDALKLVDDGSTDHEACVAAYKRCLDALKAAQQGAVKVKEGYYFFKSSRSENNATYDNGEGLLWTYNSGWERPEVLDMDNAKYVWYLKPDAENPGSYFIQNFYTKRYVGVVFEKGKSVATTEEAKESYLIYPQDKDDFVIESTSLLKRVADNNPVVGWNGEELTALHCPGDHNRVVVWTAEAPASGWVFLNVPTEQIEALENAIEQDKLNKQLAADYKKAKASYDKGFTYDFIGGKKDGSLDMDGDKPAGLLNDIANISTNAQEPGEGPLENILDNEIGDGNFFHSDWSGNCEGFDHATMYPYLQIDLGKAVNDLAVKMWARRENAGDIRVGNAPGNIIVSATNDATNEESWVTIGNVRPSYPWGRPEQTEAGVDTIIGPKTVGFADIHLGETAYRYVRLEVTSRQSNPDSDFKKLGAGAGNFNLGEIRVFETKYNATASMIEAVDKTVRATFEAQLKKAEEEIAAGIATKETIEKLAEAYKTFLDNYPDPQIVKDLLEEAKGQHDAAEEDNEKLGYFQSGAKAALQAVITEVEASVKDVMTLQEVKTAKGKLDSALNAFSGKLNKPAAGYYIIRSQSSAEGDNSPKESLIHATGNGARVKWEAIDNDALEGEPSYIWKLAVSDKGYTLQNVLTGEYMDAPKRNGSGIFMSTQADTCHFALRSAKVPGIFNIVFKENVFMNAEPGSKNVVTWGTANGKDNSAFTFENTELPEFNGSFAWKVAAGATQIITLPTNATPMGDCYSVIGRNGENLELKTITEEIPAGTPFFYIPTDEEAEQILFTTSAKNWDELLAAAATEAKEVNGLAGTLSKIDSLQVGNGILYNGVIVDSKLGEGVANNSGYITSKLPATTETGDARIMIEGKISSIQGVVSNAGKAVVVNVYNLSGVKVRANVKSTNDLKGLPAGIYIMGNKKVLVK